MSRIFSRRQQDEDLLLAISLKRAGHQWDYIGARTRMSEDYCRAACGRVRRADIAESGEDESAVARGYW